MDLHVDLWKNCAELNQIYSFIGKNLPQNVSNERNLGGIKTVPLLNFGHLPRSYPSCSDDGNGLGRSGPGVEPHIELLENMSLRSFTFICSGK